jgi:hypothetical protein
MARDENKIGIALLAIVLLVMIMGLKSPTFILYGGQEIEAELTNETGDCWTLGLDNCAKKKVNLLRLTDSGLLICPESYYSNIVDCRKAFGLIKEVSEPKLDCYYVQDDVCYLEQFEEQCPTTYFRSKESCDESLIDFAFTTKALFTSRKTLIMVGIGLVALLFMVISFLRKR